MKNFRNWLNEEVITVYRGTGPKGVTELRPSTEGVYGPGIYFYDNIESARVFAERGGGVVVAEIDTGTPGVQVIPKNVYVVGTNIIARKEKIVIMPDVSGIRILKVIPTEDT